MKYYAIVGESIQIINETKEPRCPQGYIEMQGERPSPEHIANDVGEWVLPTLQDENTEKETDDKNAS